ncbi:MAG: hypothetical protein SVM79_01945 [Chloroflexota bacterium]|nr:hypothetical protein [Chloroflexota bacterium]
MNETDMANTILRLLVARPLTKPNQLLKIIQERHMYTDSQSINNAIEYCREIFNIAFKLADEEWRGSIDQTGFSLKTRQEFPSVQEDLLEDLHARTLAHAAG